MKFVNLLAALLLVIGGINWGLVGFFNYDLVANMLGDSSMYTRIVYGLVGVCALYEAWQRTVNHKWGCSS
jgi:uncharacterized membrane protein YuzA (DUF378 family)